jgi:hypothetical protein
MINIFYPTHVGRLDPLSSLPQLHIRPAKRQRVSYLGPNSSIYRIIPKHLESNNALSYLSSLPTFAKGIVREKLQRYGSEKTLLYGIDVGHLQIYKLIMGVDGRTLWLQSGNLKRSSLLASNCLYLHLHL